MSEERTPARSDPPDGDGERVPLGQRLLNRPFLLLAACLVIFFAFYTGWGLWEMFTLDPAPLP